jgi:hypothetical protein
MTASTKWIMASVIVALAVALIWFRAPLLPALLGGAGAGLLLYWRDRRSAH